jgi:hypothetical protein
VCIEFDAKELDKLFENAITNAGSSKKDTYSCIYDENEKNEILKKCIDVYKTDFKPQDLGKSKFWNAMLDYSYMFKDEIFKYENEIRFVIRLDSKYVDDSKQGNELVNEYLKIGFYNTSDTIRPCIFVKAKDKLPIKKIFISPFNRNETVYNGLQRFLKFHGYECKVEYMKMSYRNGY